MQQSTSRSWPKVPDQEDDLRVSERQGVEEYIQMKFIRGCGCEVTHCRVGRVTKVRRQDP